MTEVKVWYASREAYKRASDARDTSLVNAKIDRALKGATPTHTWS